MTIEVVRNVRRENRNEVGKIGTTNLLIGSVWVQCSILDMERVVAIVSRLASVMGSLAVIDWPSGTRGLAAQ